MIYAAICSQNLQCCFCVNGRKADDDDGRRGDGAFWFWFVVLSAVLLWIYVAHRACVVINKAWTAWTRTTPPPHRTRVRNVHTQTERDTQTATTRIPPEALTAMCPEEVFVTASGERYHLRASCYRLHKRAVQTKRLCDTRERNLHS